MDNYGNSFEERPLFARFHLSIYLQKTGFSISFLSNSLGGGLSDILSSFGNRGGGGNSGFGGSSGGGGGGGFSDILNSFGNRGSGGSGGSGGFGGGGSKGPGLTDILFGRGGGSGSPYSGSDYDNRRTQPQPQPQPQPSPSGGSGSNGGFLSSISSFLGKLLSSIPNDRMYIESKMNK